MGFVITTRVSIGSIFISVKKKLELTEEGALRTEHPLFY